MRGTARQGLIVPEPGGELFAGRVAPGSVRSWTSASFRVSRFAKLDQDIDVHPAAIVLGNVLFWLCVVLSVCSQAALLVIGIRVWDRSTNGQLGGTSRERTVTFDVSVSGIRGRGSRPPRG